MKLHDLTVGQRFTFSDKYRGKVFEVVVKHPHNIIYKDIATSELHQAFSHREMFRMEVRPVTENRVVELTPHEVDMLQWILYGAYVDADTEQGRSEINALSIKITGLKGRRRVLPEGE